MPTNKLADDPAAKMQVVQDMINSNMITPDDGKRLLNLPDLESLNNLENAAYDNVMRAAEAMREEGTYYGPDGYMGNYLQTAINIMQMNYMRAVLDSVPEDRLELMRRWMDEAAGLMAPPSPDASAPPSPDASAPPGGPGIPGKVAGLVQGQQASATANNLQ
jgi:hypothetical protein